MGGTVRMDPPHPSPAWKEMVVIIPDDKDKVGETTYTPTPGSTPSEALDHPFSYFVSVRSVFVLISVLIVAAMAISLTVLSFSQQEKIVINLSRHIQAQIDTEIIRIITELFDWTNTKNADNFFYNLELPPNGTLAFHEMPALAEFMWAYVKERSTGVEAEFDFIDGRYFGIDNIPGRVGAYILDYDTPGAPDSNMSLYIWPANSSLPILNVNFSKELTEAIPVEGPYPIYPLLREWPRTYLNTCDSPKYWTDVIAYSTPDAHWEQVSSFRTVCNKNNTMLGYLQVSIELPSVAEALNAQTAIYAGKIFIMNNQLELVSSSTFTPIFEFEGYAQTRQTVHNTPERWIKDVYSRISTLENHSKKVHINGTEYLLQVTNFNHYTNIDWIIVQLLESNQFYADVNAYTKKSIATSTSVAVISVLIVLVVSYIATRPLLVLSGNMQKMARLNFDFNTNAEPKLMEVKRLHQSFVKMNVALKSFKKFVPAPIISKILISKKEVVAELREANITIMFQDIEGFTSLSETMDPTKLAKLTGEYMSIMTDIICKHGGTIDKYVGDCIMSLFNTPEKLPNHPVAATAAAVECYMALLERNKEWKEVYGVEMSFRTGINAGQVLIGNMGSDNRMNFTAFGDNVNIAARLEGVNKFFGTYICISKEVFKVLPKGEFSTRKLGKIRVSGKSVATSVYEVCPNASEQTKKLFSIYERALKEFKATNFTNAEVLVTSALSLVPSDKASQHLLNRIEEVIALPTLPHAWSYTETLVKF